MCIQWSRFDKMNNFNCFINGGFRSAETRTSRWDWTCKKLIGENGCERKCEVSHMGQTTRQVWPWGTERGRKRKLVETDETAVLFYRKSEPLAWGALVSPPATVSCQRRSARPGTLTPLLASAIGHLGSHKSRRSSEFSLWALQLEHCKAQGYYNQGHLQGKLALLLLMWVFSCQEYNVCHYSSFLSPWFVSRHHRFCNISTSVNILKMAHNVLISWWKRVWPCGLAEKSWNPPKTHWEPLPYIKVGNTTLF